MEKLKNLIIVGDIAGQYKAFLKLIDNFSDDHFILSVGDLMDRGPQSKQVIQWFIDNAHRANALMGNHDFMMVEACTGGHKDHWYYNGGYETEQSYAPNDVDPKHIEWLAKRPLYYEDDELFISHAPQTKMHLIETGKYTLIDANIEDLEKREPFVWGRTVPRQPYNNKTMIYGHNWELSEQRIIEPSGKLRIYARCIDSSSTKQLVALDWNTQTLHLQDYIK